MKKISNNVYICSHYGRRKMKQLWKWRIWLSKEQEESGQDSPKSYSCNKSRKVRIMLEQFKYKICSWGINFYFLSIDIPFNPKLFIFNYKEYKSNSSSLFCCAIVS
ncbi:hypothetical protein S245_049017 [Arachis hypogaea]